MKKVCLYRIYTEEKNHLVVLERATETFDAFTVYYTRGCWNKKREASMVLEYLGFNANLDLVMKFAKWVKAYNEQESVMVTTEEVQVEFV